MAKFKFLTVFGFFLPFCLILTVSPCWPAPAPTGVIGVVDSLGFNRIQWICPGVGDTTYSVGSDSWLKGMYVSNQPGSHQIACRFAVSPGRQLVDFAEIWVQKGRDCPEQEWTASAAIRVGLCRNAAGLPAATSGDLVEYCPGAAGVPPAGGYLHVEFREDVWISPADTIWLLIEWPPDQPDLVWVGVDTEPAEFNSMYRLGGQVETSWQPWLVHNIMARLHSLRYPADCVDVTEPLPQEAGEGEGSEIQGFIVGRQEMRQGMVMNEQPEFAILPGTQTCFMDPAVFVGNVYHYEIRSLMAGDTSAPASATIEAVSVLACDWTPPQLALYADREQITLAHSIRNSGPGPLTAVFLAGWLAPEDYGLSAVGAPSAGDSIPLSAHPSSAPIAGGETEIFDLFPECGLIDVGLYTMNSLFNVSSPTGSQTKYWFTSAVEVITSTGIIVEDNEPDSSVNGWCFQLYPNPGIDNIILEFVPPRREQTPHPFRQSASENAATKCEITIYNLLGHKVAGLRSAPTGSQPTRYRVVFDGRDKFGNQLPTGLYFVKVDIKGQSICRKLVVLH